MVGQQRRGLRYSPKRRRASREDSYGKRRTPRSLSPSTSSSSQPRHRHRSYSPSIPRSDKYVQRKSRKNLSLSRGRDCKAAPDRDEVPRGRHPRAREERNEAGPPDTRGVKRKRPSCTRSIRDSPEKPKGREASRDRKKRRRKSRSGSSFLSGGRSRSLRRRSPSTANLPKERRRGELHERQKYRRTETESAVIREYNMNEVSQHLTRHQPYAAPMPWYQPTPNRFPLLPKRPHRGHRSNSISYRCRGESTEPQRRDSVRIHKGPNGVELRRPENDNTKSWHESPRKARIPTGRDHSFPRSPIVYRLQVSDQRKVTGENRSEYPVDAYSPAVVTKTPEHLLRRSRSRSPPPATPLSSRAEGRSRPPMPHNSDRTPQVERYEETVAARRLPRKEFWHAGGLDWRARPRSDGLISGHRFEPPNGILRRRLYPGSRSPARLAPSDPVRQTSARPVFSGRPLPTEQPSLPSMTPQREPSIIDSFNQQHNQRPFRAFRPMRVPSPDRWNHDKFETEERDGAPVAKKKPVINLYARSFDELFVTEDVEGLEAQRIESEGIKDEIEAESSSTLVNPTS